MSLSTRSLTMPFSILIDIWGKTRYDNRISTPHDSDSCSSWGKYRFLRSHQYIITSKAGGVLSLIKLNTMESMVQNMKKILILGANGFIGRNLKEYLELEHELYKIQTPSSKEFDVYNEQAVKNYLEKEYFDVIIHAAVYNPRIGDNKEATIELDKNLRMFFNFERYQRLYGKMLYFGSGAEYDKRGKISMISENDAGNGIPATYYGFYKYIINQSIRNSENIYNLRIFGLFGKYENWRKTFISGACCKALKGIPITVRQNVYFDYLFIDDFCKIVKWFIEHEAIYKEYNITSGVKISLLELVSIVKQISGKELQIYVCNEGLANEYSACNQRLLSELGNFTFTPIEKAIHDLYKWYQNQVESIDLYSLLYQ